MFKGRNLGANVLGGLSSLLENDVQDQAEGDILLKVIDSGATLSIMFSCSSHGNCPEAKDKRQRQAQK